MIQASVLPKNGSWSTPTTLSDSGQDAQSPEVGTDKSGNAVAIWSRFDGMNSIIQSSKKPFSGSWTSSVNVSDGGQNADSPELAMDFSGDVGNAVAVWHRFNDTNHVIQAAYLPFGGSWSASVDLSALDKDSFEPIVVLAPSGNATAMWIEFDGSNYIAQAATLPLGGSWSAPVNLSATGQDVSYINIDVDTTGNVVAVWDRSNGTESVVQAATLPLNGSWSSATTISTPDQYAFFPKVSLNAGNVTAAWLESNGTYNVITGATLAFGQ